MKKFLAFLINIVFFNIICFSLSWGQTASKGINIKSDTAKIYPEKKSLVFSGNVSVRNDKMSISCKTLTIFYKNSDSMQENPDINSINQIEASGRVVIKLDGKTATAEKAVFLPKKEKLVLSGGRPVIKNTDSGDLTISGDIIVYNMKSGEMEIDKSSGKQVEVTFINGQ
ncbi:MAG: hypothetical protein CSA18_02150 [Deltaproteobacteria bacterium]|nr:MAG: hypothetical protein CSB21_01315 [Deltaproteobacteria bacterium]PIE74938.1 MAG: hypothetical protein CSA18_02150 [Deltaproteobacteria bacterium]